MYEVERMDRETLQLSGACVILAFTVGLLVLVSPVPVEAPKDTTDLKI
jgi:hypothetical protein